MNSNMQTQSASVDARMRTKNRIKLLILWLVPFGLMAIAGLSYYLVQTGRLNVDSTNNGVLIRPPIQLNELLANSLQLQSGAGESPWLGKWTLIVRGDANCSSPCSEALHLSRQIHIRLDKNANRVQRILMADNLPLGESLQGVLADQHHYLRVATAGAAELEVLDSATTSTNGERAQFFVVDPQGWAMMYYLAEHEGNAILKDLKHLLKYSAER